MASLTFQIALGDTPGRGYILAREGLDHPSTFQVERDGSGPAIEIETLDRFCATQSISQIDILKIDVEGQEIDVLRGARTMLAHQKIILIKAECAVDPDNAWHTPFSSLCEFLFPLEYRLFGIYEQCECWKKKLPTLRRFDAAFVSKHAALARH